MQQAIFGAFASSTNVDIVLGNVAGRPKQQGVSTDGAVPTNLYVYSSGEDISGEVKVAIMGGKKIDHTGIKIELKGIVESFVDKQSHEFVSSVLDLSGPGTLSGVQAFPFRFARTDLPHESYAGSHARVRYFLRAVVSKSGYSGSASKEQDILVQNVISSGPSDKMSAIKLEVGIEDILHLEFEYDRSAYHLQDIVTGRIDFLLVRIKIKHMEIAVIRRESVLPGPSGPVAAPVVTSSSSSSGAAAAVTAPSAGPSNSAAATVESETLTRFEVMDGAPIKGERIPVRLHLSGLDVSPTLSNVGNVLSVRCVYRRRMPRPASSLIPPSLVLCVLLPHSTFLYLSQRLLHSLTFFFESAFSPPLASQVLLEPRADRRGGAAVLQAAGGVSLAQEHQGQAMSEQKAMQRFMM